MSELPTLIQTIDTDPLLRPLWRHVKSLGQDDPAHDPSHLLRVAYWAMKFAGNNVEPNLLIAASLLHDLVNLPKDHPERASASRFSAEKARPLLQSAGFSSLEINEICKGIAEHSFSGGDRPSSLLSECLQDADRVEALGSIGIFRWIGTGTKMNAYFFDGFDPWAKNRNLDDRKFSLDHYFTKLKKLPALMNTELGRQEAKRRIERMRKFVNDLGEELGEPAACESL